MAEAIDAPQYTPGSDPVGFDREFLDWLIRAVGPDMERTIALIKNRRPLFNSMSTLLEEAIDVELLYRQLSPAFLIARVEDWPRDHVAEFGFVYAHAQTIILNNIDRHLDLSSSYTISDPINLMGDVRRMLAFAPHSIHFGVANVECPSLANLAASLKHMTKVTSEILQSMLDNFSDRYNRQHLVRPDALVNRYIESPQSRHLGSGFYSSSILGIYGFFDAGPPFVLPETLLNMRRLRQRVDELGDLYEDLMTGLVTYPVARALMEDRSGRLARLISEAWDVVRPRTQMYAGNASEAISLSLESTACRDVFAPIREELRTFGILEQCADEARNLAYGIIATVNGELRPEIAKVIGTLVCAKLALADRLQQQDFVDLAPSHAFESLRAKWIHEGG